MYNKVFQIGHTKRKSIPVLYQTDPDTPKWADVFLLSNHLFDSTMRDYKINCNLKTLLRVALCDILDQTFTTHTSMVLHAYYPLTQIRKTRLFFIPVHRLFLGKFEYLAVDFYKNL